VRLLVVVGVFLITVTALAGGAPQVVTSPADVAPELAEPIWNLDPREPLTLEQESWVEQRLAAMTLEERVGQLLMVRVFGEYYAADSAVRADLENMVRDLSLGGVILFRSEVYEAAAVLQDLQTVAKESSLPPLIVASDFEWGADFRINGAVPFPTAMAVGATFDPATAEWMGRASARDARALGIHWIFAPVADVNVDPLNPVINVRAFGQDPAQVGEMAAAFVRGAQAGGVLATAKHFPGHGDTGVDSHIRLPILTHDEARLEAVELAPFRRTIEAGVASVMTAHMAVPALTEARELPATLSHRVLTQLLRERMAFEGLIVTDAMEMGGITRQYWSGEAAREAVNAGSDMVLLPPRPRAVHADLVRSVKRGDISEARLEEAVRRVLEAKARLGLMTESPEMLATLPEAFGPAAEIERARDVSRQAVTLLRDRDGLLPLDARRWQSVVVVGVSDNDTAAPTGALVGALRGALASVETYSIDGRTHGDEAADIVAAAAKARTLVLAVRVRVRTGTGEIELPDPQARYAEMLQRLDVPTIVVALGSPYSVAAFPEASTALVTYGWSTPLQEAAAGAITGAIPISGRLPVSVPGAYAVGDGLQRAPLAATLGEPGGQPAAADSLAPDLAAARDVLVSAIARGAFPGAVYAIGHANQLVALEAVGKLTYGENAAPVPVDALFDLASLTKVVGTTPVAMLAAARGDIRLDYPVRALVPEFSGAGRDDVTVRHLLTHTSGLPAYVEFYRDYDPGDLPRSARDEILERIYTTALQRAPGAGYEYSDLGIILLGEVLSRALGEPYWEYAAREVFLPLGMTETGWLPAAENLARIPPTEEDPWRGRLVRGEVHDENAHAMGGISSHAGLFSTARDLATYAQTFLNMGTYDHRRVFPRASVATFTRRQDLPAGSGRALGWDTAYESDRWGMFSPGAFGHTGYTGTSLWIDPQRDLFVILLTNRVHPTRENTRHVAARVEFHTEVVAAIDRLRASQ
jgi:beta-glucosidase-like glycosyl hydrolase/CubicO group peptidase (beta-lactamase class C family)